MITGHSPFSFFEINNPLNKRVRLFTENAKPWSQGFHQLTDLLGKRPYFTTQRDGTFSVIMSTLLFALLLTMTSLQRISIIVSLIAFLVLFMVIVIVGS